MSTADKQKQVHTPGPWEADGAINEEYSHVITAYSEDGQDVDVAHVCKSPETWEGGDKFAPFGDDAANARLIAAAPDLLEACRIASRVIESCRYIGENAATLPPRQLEYIQSGLSAAIRKAEEGS